MILNKKEQGFTLIELMITVTIVGVLTALAVPAYQDYAIRSQVAEGIALASGGKVVVSEYYSNRGEFPTDNAAAGYAGAVGKYITGVEIAGTDDTDVSIEATFGGSDVNKKLNGLTVSLFGVPNASGTILWSCTSEIEAKYLPNSCNYIEGDGSTNPNPGGENGGGNEDGGTDPGGSTEPEVPVTPEPEPFDLQSALDLFPDRLDQGLVFGDNLEVCQDPTQCHMFYATYTGKQTLEQGQLIVGLMAGGQQVVLSPTSLDENGNLVYKVSNQPFSDFSISSVKINPDKTISFYREDPNDPTKEIIINPIYRS